MSGWSLIPVPARILAAVVFLAPPVLVARLFGALPETLFAAVVGAMLAATVLLAGYVYGDAPRRGMPRAAWTALALMAPNGIGFILYFVLRKPIERPCPGCGAAIAADAAFCPRCGAAQSAETHIPPGNEA